MTHSGTTARIHLLGAKEAPVAVIVRRKPSRTWHILKWNLLTDELTPGSWFRGKLYPMRSDLSWDGRLMSYFAMGSRGDIWSGICEVPFLKTVVHWTNTSTFNGGAVWLQRNTVYRNLIWMDYPIEAAEFLIAGLPRVNKTEIEVQRREPACGSGRNTNQPPSGCMG